MASSRGRERTQQRGPRIFVFGSSTPRDLSHMNKIPTHLRKYDVRLHTENHNGPKLSEYMQKARSLTREGKSVERSWAFGSSTPRDLAHMTGLKPALRRYDAVLPKKSSTVPNFVATPFKRSSTIASVARQSIQSQDSLKNEQKERPIKDDDVSSEPDFIQDRAGFLNELKEIKENMAGIIKADSEKKTTQQMTETFEKPEEIGSEVTLSQIIPLNYHEEETNHTASQLPIQPILQDQVIIADLIEEKPELKEIEITAQKVGELMTDSTSTIHDEED